MTTDDMKEPETQLTEELSKTENKESVNSNADLVAQMKAMLDDSIAEMKKTFEEKTKELNETIAEKDKEIANLKQANANIVLTSNFTKENNGQPDYSSMEFDEVDQSIWNSQAKSFMNSIDSKIFDLKVKTN